MKKELKNNLDKLKAEAAKIKAKDIDLIIIEVADTGGITACVNATGDSYGTWRFGDPGDVVTDFEMTHDGMLSMDTELVAVLLARMIALWQEQFE